MTITQTIAMIIGVYMLAGGIGLLREGASYGNVLKEMRDSISLSFIGGIMTFAIGGSIVALHNDWSNPLAIAVSLVGWAALIEGGLILALRETFLGFVEKISFTPMVVRGFGILTLAFGAWLLYMACA